MQCLNWILEFTGVILQQCGRESASVEQHISDLCSLVLATKVVSSRSRRLTACDATVQPFRRTEVERIV